MPETERKYTARMLYVIVAVLTLIPGGCLAVVAGLAAGGAAGGYLYYKYDKGKIYRDYPASLTDVRNAVHAALTDLHFQVATEGAKDGRTLVVTHTTDGKKVQIYIDCLASPIPAEGMFTRVAIRVSHFGDEGVSIRILDQVSHHLTPAAVIVPAPTPGPTPLQPTSAIQPVAATEPPLAPPQPVKASESQPARGASKGSP
jgi:hypothetical protein